MSKVLIAIPPLSESIWARPATPLGSAYLATALQKAGHEVEAIDYSVHRSSRKRIARSLREISPDFVLLSSTFGGIENSKRLASLIKQHSNSTVIFGGLPATSIPDKLAKETTCIDIYVRGEGEETIVDIVNRLPLSEIKGITYLSDDKVISTPDRELIQNIDTLGIPQISLFPLEHYCINTVSRSVLVETSRGCPCQCNFCTQPPKEGTKLRTRSPEIFTKEIENISAKNFIKHVVIVDNDFLIDRNHATNIMNAIIKKGWNKSIHFHIGTRIDRLIRGGDELLHQLKESGITSVFVGIESLSKKKIEDIGKIKNIQETVKICNKYLSNGISIVPSFIIGFPEENLDDIYETFQHACELNTPNIIISLLTPYPGTRLYDEYEKQGLILTSDFNSYNNALQIIKHPVNLEKYFIKLRRQYFFRLSYLKSFKAAFQERRIFLLGIYIINELRITRRIVTKLFSKLLPFSFSMWHKD